MSAPAANLRALPLLLMLGGIWGSSFLFIKVLVDEIEPVEVVLGRLMFGALAVGSYVAIARAPLKIDRALILKGSVLAVLTNMAPFGLIAWGQVHIDSGIASVLNSTMPIFTAVFAALVLTEEKLTAGRVGGLVLAFLGVLVLTGDDIVNITESHVLGQLAIVGAAMCYGAGAVYLRTLLASYTAITLSVTQLVLGTIYSIPLVLAVAGGVHYDGMSLEAWGALLGLGILGTGLAYVAYLYLIDVIGSVRASLVTYIIPVVGLFLGWAVLSETIGIDTIIGSAIIIGGVAVVMRGQAPASRRAPQVGAGG